MPPAIVPATSTVKDLLDSELRRQVATPAPGSPPARAKALLDALVEHKYKSYKTGALVLLAFSVAASGGRLDVTHRPSRARTIGQFVGNELYLDLRISGVPDVFGNIGKNARQLVRGNVSEWDELLTWMSSAATTDSELQEAFEYLAYRIASTAQAAPTAVDPVTSRMTFPRVAAMFDALFDKPSGGAYEQFSVAALMHAETARHHGDSLVVRTKGINATDRSAGVPGDIQVVDDTGRVLRVLEVTANSWRLKLGQARRVLMEDGAASVTIVADTSDHSPSEILDALDGENIAVVDLRQEVRSLLSRLSPHDRRVALLKLSEYLAAENSRPELLLGFHECMKQHGVDDDQLSP